MKIHNRFWIALLAGGVLLPIVFLMMQQNPTSSGRMKLGMASGGYGTKSQTPDYSEKKPVRSSGVCPEIEWHNLAGETTKHNNKNLKENSLSGESPNTTNIFKQRDQNTSAKDIFADSIGSGGLPVGRTPAVALRNSVPSGEKNSAVGPLAVQEVSRDLVETSMDLSVPAGAPLPAVVAASLESAAAETLPPQSSAREVPGMDGILSDYVSEAERPVPPERRLQQAQVAAESADERFGMLYGHDAYLKYTVEAARLSLQESR